MNQQAGLNFLEIEGKAMSTIYLHLTEQVCPHLDILLDKYILVFTECRSSVWPDLTGRGTPG